MKPKIRVANPELDISVGEIKAIQQAIAELVSLGLVEDTGERRNGRIVWRLTELGRLAAGADKLQ